MPSSALRGAPQNQSSNPEHADVLRRCAECDPNCLRELEAAFGDQVRSVLARALGSTEIAAFTLPAVFADLRDRADAFDPERQAAEDWVFGQVRARLRELTRAAGQLATAPQSGAAKPAPAPLRPAPFRPVQPSTFKLRAVRAPAASAERFDPRSPPGEVAQARAVPVNSPVRRRPRRLSLRRGVGVAAAAVLIVAGVGILMLPERSDRPQVTAVPRPTPATDIPARAPTGVPVPQQPVPVSPLPADPLPHPLATPSAANVMRPPSGVALRYAAHLEQGAPAAVSQAVPEPTPMPPDTVLLDPQPPSSPVTATDPPSTPAEKLPVDASTPDERRDTAAAVPQAAPKPQPPRNSAQPVPRPTVPAIVEPYSLPPPAAGTAPADSAIPPPATRVFIHHTAGSDPDAAAAQALTERLRGQGFEVIAIRPVPFTIRTGSVRYYFDQDRAAARQLAALADPLAGSGLPRPPLDFRHYEPKPSVGTVEVWIETR